MTAFEIGTRVRVVVAERRRWNLNRIGIVSECPEPLTMGARAALHGATVVVDLFPEDEWGPWDPDNHFRPDELEVVK